MSKKLKEFIEKLRAGLGFGWGAAGVTTA